MVKLVGDVESTSSSLLNLCIPLRHLRHITFYDHSPARKSQSDANSKEASSMQLKARHISLFWLCFSVEE